MNARTPSNKLFPSFYTKMGRLTAAQSFTTKNGGDDISQKTEYRNWMYYYRRDQKGCTSCHKDGRYRPFCVWCGSISHPSELCMEPAEL